MATSQKQRDAVNGWIRNNYSGKLLKDIVTIITKFFQLNMNSKIITESVAASFLDLIFDTVRKQKDYQSIQSLNTKLLYRASEQGFSSSKFFALCSVEEPTIVIIQNTLDHIFGGYTTKSWGSSGYWVNDPNAFLFTIQPKLSVIFHKAKHKETGYCAINISDGVNYGPIFGSMADIRIANKCNLKDSDNYCTSDVFEFDFIEMIGDNGWSIQKYQHNFVVKEYEVYSILYS